MIGRFLDKEAAAILATLGGEEALKKITGGDLVGSEHQNGFWLRMPERTGIGAIEFEADGDGKTFTATVYGVRGTGEYMRSMATIGALKILREV